MMRALVVYCHPDPASFNRAVLGVVLDGLGRAGAEVRIHDLHADGFNPVMSRTELTEYLNTSKNRVGVAVESADLAWCDTLVFVYPTWWYGLPAMLKGWLDKVLLPGVAFHMPEANSGSIQPGLRHITRLAVFTTGGASRWLTWIIGAPGKRTIFRGVRANCARKLRTAFAVHYLMDSSTPDSRARHLERVRAKMARFTAP